MNSITADWKIYKGNYYSRTITLIVKETGKPIDITGYKFYFTIKSALADADNSVLQKSWTSHVTPLEGITAMELTVAETNALTAGQYIFGISFFDVSTPKKKYTAPTGNIEVQIDPTLAVT